MDLVPLGSKTAKNGFRNEEDVVRIFNNWQEDELARAWLSKISSGFNQIDKRWVYKYIQMWNIPDDVSEVLKRFTGELPPNIKNPKDLRRMFLDEFSKFEQELLLGFIEQNRILIVSDILKGRGEFSADWMLVIVRKGERIEKWALEEIGIVMNFLVAEKLKLLQEEVSSLAGLPFKEKVAMVVETRRKCSNSKLTHQNYVIIS